MEEALKRLMTGEVGKGGLYPPVATRPAVVEGGDGGKKGVIVGILRVGTLLPAIKNWGE